MRMMTLRILPRLAVALLLGAVGLSAGCSGGPKTTVKGAVTYQQSPVGGTVVFAPESGGKEFEGPLDGKGEYTINGAPKGKYKVYFKKSPTVGLGGTGGMVGPDGKPLGDNMPGMGSSKPLVNPPDKYLDKATSDLTFEVTGGKQDYPITLNQ